VCGFNTPHSLLWLKFLDLIYSIRAMSVLSASSPIGRIRPVADRTDSSCGEPPADIIVTNTFWLPILLRNSKRGQIYVHVARYPKGQMRFYGKAARLQAPSQAVARAIVAEAPRLEQKVSVVPNPVPEAPIASPPPAIADCDKTILFVGRVHPEKGVHVLVDAFASGARAAFADWKLMMVGPTETKLGGGGEAYLVSLQHAAENAKGKV